MLTKHCQDTFQEKIPLFGGDNVAENIRGEKPIRPAVLKRLSEADLEQWTFFSGSTQAHARESVLSQQKTADLLGGRNQCVAEEYRAAAQIDFDLFEGRLLLPTHPVECDKFLGWIHLRIE